MPELLLEVGCEELPAAFVRKAYTDLRDRLVDDLSSAFAFPIEEAVAFGTPRRLIVSVPELPSKQPDSAKEVRGPGVKAAYDGSGNPTPALLGFCRSSGVDPKDLRSDEQYVWATKRTEGKPTADLLKELLPKAVLALTFEKSMRWGIGRTRFARPIRWILAVYEGKVVDFEIEGVVAGTQSRGHRFYAPAPFEARRFDELRDGLAERKVEIHAERREAMIRDGALAASAGRIDLDEDLVEENTFLTEWPSAIAGEFRPEYLELPAPVLITAMAKHEKVFSVRGEGGELINQFVFIRNSGEDDTVRKGVEWVLNARLDDAKFFYAEDQKSTLDHFLEKTSGIVFQAELGTVRQRADRLSQLAVLIAQSTGADAAEIEFAKQAGLYAKADLSTGLVSEFASLQGVIGGEYAKREGFPDAVCWAIASHYDHAKNPHPDCAGARTALRLSLADALDKLAGYLGLGLAPTGSSDPFGLRRAATTLIEVAWIWPGRMPDFETLFKAALDLYPPGTREKFGSDTDVIYRRLEELFDSRYTALLSGARPDILRAASHVGASIVTAPQSVRFRLRAVEASATNVPLVQAAVRVLNIVDSARKKNLMGDNPDESLLTTAEERELLQAAAVARSTVPAAAEKEEVETVLTALAELVQPINRFFEATMVMVEDVPLRTARLALLDQIAKIFLYAGDFTQLEG